MTLSEHESENFSSSDSEDVKESLLSSKQTSRDAGAMLQIRENLIRVHDNLDPDRLTKV